MSKSNFAACCCLPIVSFPSLSFHFYFSFSFSFSLCDCFCLFISVLLLGFLVVACFVVVVVLHVIPSALLELMVWYCTVKDQMTNCT